jgi:hypothetical protein
MAKDNKDRINTVMGGGQVVILVIWNRIASNSEIMKMN